MARFEVYRADRGFLLDVQTDLLGGLTTRIVVPLLPLDIAPHPGRKLNPSFTIEGRPYRMVTQFMSAVPAGQLGHPVGNLEAHYDEIVAALDMIFLGF